MRFRTEIDGFRGFEIEKGSGGTIVVATLPFSSCIFFSISKKEKHYYLLISASLHYIIIVNKV